MRKSFMRDNLEDNWGILSLQDKILEIMVYIDEICKDNNIKYYLMGGTALGVKRHGGFIPWDDDLDIFMTPDNYEKFREVFNNHGDKLLYYLQEWGNSKDGHVKISKLRMNGTTYIEPLLKDKDMHHGIYVDIFILHTSPDSKLKQIIQYIWAKYIVVKGLSDRGYSKRGGIVGFLLKILGKLPPSYLFEFALGQVYKYRNEPSGYYCNFLGKAGFKRGLYNKDWFGNGKYINFEKVKLNIPDNIEEFLSKRFGDYMKAPSLDRIKWEQHAENWSVDRDFRDFIPIIKDYKDEKHLL